MTQKTAMMQLIEFLESDGYQFDLNVINNAIKQERTQIEEAWNEGMISGYTDYDNSEDYFTQTYEQ